MGVKEGERRLNVDLPSSTKTRLDVYAAKENEHIKIIVAMALEMFLDEMGAQKF